MIYVTKPFMPPLEEFVPLLEEIWDSGILSNSGPFHKKFEAELIKTLGISSVSLTCNGTLALLLAIKALDISDSEIITTPFSFVATASGILWSGNRPVFADVDAETANIDPLKIEQVITSKTKAILAVHCYGHPCDVEAIEGIARKNRLAVIYDASHAFGLEINGKSILNYGDLSTLSFHATKPFQTFEGGAVASSLTSQKEKIDRLKNFGFVQEGMISEVGINAKMNEISAAFGLLQLPKFKKALESRAIIAQRYRDQLEGVAGILHFKENEETTPNYAYHPIKVTSCYNLDRDGLMQKLISNEIVARRYFYPLITDVPAYSSFGDSKKLLNASILSRTVLCLPIYPDLSLKTVDKICSLIRSSG